MPGQRKYIIGGFLTFVTLFVGIYFGMGFILRKDSLGYCGTVNDYALISNDTSRSYKDGKVLFQNKCAACHILFKDFTGPDLIGFTKRGPWVIAKKLSNTWLIQTNFIKKIRVVMLKNCIKRI
jgi:hypothetical protein